ncbi:MAG TPA: ABC transporter substrate-binding protein, partial [Naasia sp.]|jgi:peptide/nickel transport system substrate-binding protein
VDVGTWIGTIIGQPDAWDMTIYADLNFLGALTSPLTAFMGPTILEGGGNVGATNNADAEAAFQAAIAEEDEDARCGLLQEAQQALIDNADTVPMINDAFIYVQRPGFKVSLLGGSLDDPIFRVLD